MENPQSGTSIINNDSNSNPNNAIKSTSIVSSFKKKNKYNETTVVKHPTKILNKRELDAIKFKV